LRKRLISKKVVGVDPLGSILAHKEEESVLESFYEVEGIGYDFYPTVLDKNLIDSWIKTVDKESFQMARQLILLEGLLCGGSSGAAMSAAVRAAAGLEAGKRVVVLLPDGIRNYMSKFVNDEWMLQRNYIDQDVEEPVESSPWYHSLKLSAMPVVSRLQTIESDMRIKAAIDLMKQHGFDQLPVVQKQTGQLVGVITMQMALASVIGHKLSFDDAVDQCVTNDFPKLDSDDSLGKLSRLLKRFHFVLIVHKDEEQVGEKVIGIVTHVDILNYLLQAAPTTQ
jgi:cystathionine beta-synthase